MPQFRYQATDASGRTVEGQIQAGDAAEATRMLGTRGYQVRAISDINLQQRVQTPQQPPQRPVQHAAQRMAGQAAPPIARTTTETPRPTSPPSLNAIPQRAAPVERRTRKGSEKTNFFLFSQLASFLRAGTNPADAFSNVASHCTRADYREAFTRASQAASEGRPTSDVLAEYTDLFLPHIPGLMRAGEQGGFLPEVVEAISKQSKESYQYKLVFKILHWTWISFLAGIPLGIMIVDGGLNTWDAQSLAGGRLSGSGAMMDGQKTAFIGALPLLLGCLAAYLIIRALWASRANRRRRHRWLLKIPVIGKRATHESIAVLCWILGLLGKTGMAPRSSLEIAASAMPNLELSEQFGSVAGNISESVTLSQALHGNRSLPPEFIPMVATGEVTGDVATQLFQLSEAARTGLKAEENQTKWRTGCWIAIIIALFSTFTVWLVYGRLYGGISDSLDREVNEATTGGAP
ncbi:MAG: type II secretion system F family protein [Fimbriimonadaceae bacterium]|nr:type II secretion system F family protein [Fimbriimonadaceae bacterium]